MKTEELAFGWKRITIYDNEDMKLASEMYPQLLKYADIEAGMSLSFYAKEDKVLEPIYYFFPEGDPRNG